MALIIDGTFVQNLTGATVTDATITQAQGLMSLFSGYDLDADTLLTEDMTFLPDQRKIRMAVAYQAAFMVAHPDIFTAADISSSSADGYSQAWNELGAVIAPLAKIALRKLTRKRSRSVRVHAPFEAIQARRLEGGLVPENLDQSHSWQPM